jgi:hypothetical protein
LKEDLDNYWKAQVNPRDEDASFLSILKAANSPSEERDHYLFNLSIM